MTMLLTSKKFIAAALATGVALVARGVFELDRSDVAFIVAPLITYIGAQGLADFGKEKKP